MGINGKKIRNKNYYNDFYFEEELKLKDYKIIKSVLVNGSTLDVGCGEMVLSRIVNNYEGCDFFKFNRYVSVCKAENLKTKKDIYNNIVLKNMLSHCDNVIKCLEQVEKKCDVNGKIIIMDYFDISKKYYFWCYLNELRFKFFYKSSFKHNVFYITNKLKLKDFLFLLHEIFIGYKICFEKLEKFKYIIIMEKLEK